jgi:hypothetical protein
VFSTSVEPSKTKPKLKCKFHPNSSSHSTADCKTKGKKKPPTSASKEIGMVEFEINMIEMSPDYNDPNLVICDSGAQTSIFSNESLLFNIRDCDDAVKIGGISSSSKSFSVTKSGQLQGFEDRETFYLSVIS